MASARMPSIAMNAPVSLGRSDSSRPCSSIGSRVMTVSRPPAVYWAAIAGPSAARAASIRPS
jgi:hypothetical protein